MQNYYKVYAKKSHFNSDFYKLSKQKLDAKTSTQKKSAKAKHAEIKHAKKDTPEQVNWGKDAGSSQTGPSFMTLFLHPMARLPFEKRNHRPKDWNR